jgi:hypothetical protein
MAITSEVDICNEALAYIGASPIVSLDENTQEARTCKRFYATTRDSYLQSHPWSFATQMVPITELSLPDKFKDYEYIYSFPAKCLKLLSVRMEDGREEMAFIIRTFSDTGGANYKTILSNANPAYAECIFRITDPCLFDSLFTEALSLALSKKLAIPISRRVQLLQSVTALFREANDRALEADAQAEKPDETPVRWENKRKGVFPYSGGIWRN